MKIEDVKNFVDTVSNIKEQVCFLENSTLCVNNGESIVKVPCEDIYSISMERKWHSGFEIFVNTQDKDTQLVLPAVYIKLFENGLQPVLYVITTYAKILWNKIYIPLVSAAVGFGLGYLTFSGII